MSCTINSLSFPPLPDSPFKYPIPNSNLELFVSTDYKQLRSTTDNLICFLDATRYNMMMITTEGSDVPMEPVSYGSGSVELGLQATSPQMTLGHLAWMIEGEDVISESFYRELGNRRESEPCY